MAYSTIEVPTSPMSVRFLSKFRFKYNFQVMFKILSMILLTFHQSLNTYHSPFPRSNFLCHTLTTVPTPCFFCKSSASHSEVTHTYLPSNIHWNILRPNNDPYQKFDEGLLFAWKFIRNSPTQFCKSLLLQ